MTRIYIPATLTTLASAYAAGALPGPLQAHAVTPAIREWYVEGDLEELEYVALTEAAEASLRRLAADPDAPRRRVVVAADVPDGAVQVDQDDRFRSRVSLNQPVPVSAVASVHVDETEAMATVAEAILVLARADAGEDDAKFVLDEAEAAELLWYDVSEIADLI